MYYVVKKPATGQKHWFFQTEIRISYELADIFQLRVLFVVGLLLGYVCVYESAAKNRPKYIEFMSFSC